MAKKIGILFVCTGNICRSPAAEGVFLKKAAEAGILDRLRVDSAGTIGYHEGEQADPRMIAAAERRGYPLPSIARKVTRADIGTFDYVIAMDRDHLFHLHSMDKDGKHEANIRLFMDFHPNPDRKDVPDPYYGGPQGFEDVLDLVEGCSDGLIVELKGKL